jgi:hypothetical protein
MSEIQHADIDLDLDAIANSWLGTPLSEEGDQAEPEGDSEGEPASSSPSNEDAVEQVQSTTRQLSEDEEQAIYQRRLQADIARVRAEREQAQLQQLLENGSAEEIAEWTRQQIAENQRRVEAETLTAEAAAQAEADMIVTLLDEEFINSLSQEEAQSLLPENYSDTKSYIKAITNMRIQKASSGLLTEEEVERRVQERLKGMQNVQRGQQFRGVSPTTLPPSTGEGDPYAGMDGASLKDALWRDIVADWDNGDSER